jgi:hypothetical protein
MDSTRNSRLVTRSDTEVVPALLPLQSAEAGEVVNDKAYFNDELRVHMAGKSTTSCTPLVSYWVTREIDHMQIYRKRHCVENLFKKSYKMRRISPLYEKPRSS